MSFAWQRGSARRGCRRAVRAAVNRVQESRALAASADPSLLLRSFPFAAASAHIRPDSNTVTGGVCHPSSTRHRIHGPAAAASPPQPWPQPQSAIQWVKLCRQALHVMSSEMSSCDTSNIMLP